ncbi:toll/interleukin-1 receptor domain-containing protein, partial [Candidatus Protofrankia californiensis]|uniref:toll/interleukin-1 receptor domain-containing protein n=1 Tax=Candidatus Protofrankia californiensis TaxID=1839754 RepID=UPI0010414B76
SPQALNIEIYFYTREKMSPLGYVSFYEEFARRVPVVNEIMPATPAPSTPHASTKPLTSLLELESERQLLEAELVQRRRDGRDDGDLLVKLRENQDRRLLASEREQDDRNPPVSVFISYAHADDLLRRELIKHLANLKRAKIIREWHDREIVAGMDWRKKIDDQLDRAEVILFLLSPDFMASDYCVGIEAVRAVERHATGDACLIPVLLRAVDWQGSIFDSYQALPRDARPVTQWKDRDAAFLDIAQGIRRAIDRLGEDTRSAV